MDFRMRYYCGVGSGPWLRSRGLVAVSTVTFAEMGHACTSDPLSTDEHWNRAVGNDLCGYAAEQEPAQTAPSVRGHHNQVTAILVCGLQDPFAGILVLSVQGSAVDVGLRASLLTPDRMAIALSLADFSYSSIGKPEGGVSGYQRCPRLSDGHDCHFRRELSRQVEAHRDGFSGKFRPVGGD
jgi:hypothetical protein